jgi:hypothetical protein
MRRRDTDAPANRGHAPNPSCRIRSGIQTGVMQDQSVKAPNERTQRHSLDTGFRRNDGHLSIDLQREIAPALFGLRADILFFARAKKMYAKESTPPEVAGCAGSRAGTCARGRADTTSCRGGTFADVLSAHPLRAASSPAPSKGVETKSITSLKCGCLIQHAMVDASPLLTFGSLPRCRSGFRAQWVARQGSRASTAVTGRHVGACPEHGSPAGTRRNASAPRGAAFSFGYFSLGKQRKVTRPQGEKGRCDFARQINLETTRGDLAATINRNAQTKT